MRPILLADEAITLIRQLGARTAAELAEHLPQHTEAEVDAALRSAASRGHLAELPGGSYGYEASQPVAEDDDASAIVEQALRARSTLELGWCGALAV